MLSLGVQQRRIEQYKAPLVNRLCHRCAATLGAPPFEPPHVQPRLTKEALRSVHNTSARRAPTGTNNDRQQREGEMTDIKEHHTGLNPRERKERLTEPNQGTLTRRTRRKRSERRERENGCKIARHDNKYKITNALRLETTKGAASDVCQRATQKQGAREPQEGRNDTNTRGRTKKKARRHRGGEEIDATKGTTGKTPTANSMTDRTQTRTPCASVLPSLSYIS